MAESNHLSRRLKERTRVGLGRDKQSVGIIETGWVGSSVAINVALSLPTIVGLGGAVEVIEPELDEAERAALSRSAGILRSVIDAVA